MRHERFPIESRVAQWHAPLWNRPDFNVQRTVVRGKNGPLNDEALWDLDPEAVDAGHYQSLTTLWRLFGSTTRAWL